MLCSRWKTTMYEQHELLTPQGIAWYMSEQRMGSRKYQLKAGESRAEAPDEANLTAVGESALLMSGATLVNNGNSIRFKMSMLRALLGD